MQVSLGPGHIVLDGDPAPSTKGTQPPVFGPYLLWPNGWMDQDATWYGGRPLPKRHYVRWRPSSPLEKGGTVPPIFGPCLLWPNGCMDEDETSHAGRPRPRQHCVRWGPSTAPNFRSMSIVAKWLDASRCHLVRRSGSAHPPPPEKKRHSPKILCPCLLWQNGWMDQDDTSYGGRPMLRPHCVKWRPSSILQGAQPPSRFSAHVCCAKRLDGSRCHFVRR